MPTTRSPIYAFNGGEISRRMEGRSDLDGIYDRSLATMLNYVATVEGPATKRPGFRFIKEASLTSTWLTRFVFNSTQAYVIEWLEGAVRFFTNGGRIEGDDGPLELAVPYLAAEAPRISAKQSYDRLYLAHAAHPPGMITRTGAETFEYAPTPLKDGPFKDFNTDKTQTISWSGDGTVGGLAHINSDVDIFEAAHVGASFIFETVSFANNRAWEPGVKTRATDSTSEIYVGALCRSDGKIYKCVNATAHYTGGVEPTHTQGAEWDGSGGTPIGRVDGDTCGCKWEYQHDRFGIGVIQSVESSTSATIKVTRALPTLAEPSWHWAHACFSDVEGWPQLVTVWGGRLIYVKGIELIASVVGDYWNMAPIDEGGIFAPDQAFRLELSISDPPTWIHADKEFLLLGTASEEIVVSQVNQAAGISGTNLSAQPQSSYGSALCWPQPIGTGVVFVQRGARRIREASFSYEAGRFVGANLTIYARHITKSLIKWLAWQQDPEGLIWAGRGDGTLIAHAHSPEQDVKGFSRHELAEGTIKAGVAVPSDSGEADQLWILAELDGAPAVLQLGEFWDEDAGASMADAFFVDWGVSYDGTELDGDGVPLGPKAHFSSGLSHLEGKTVRILADGAEINHLVVEGGAITLPSPATKVHIGLGYAGRLKLLRAEARGVPTLQGMRKRAIRLFARLIDSAALVVRSRNGLVDRLFNRPNTLPMDAPTPLYNGDTNNVSIGSASDYSDAPELVSDDALPSIVSLLVPTYEIEEVRQ